MLGPVLPTDLVRVLDAVRSTYPTSLSDLPDAFELALDRLVPMGFVERHGAWRFTLTVAGIRALRLAQSQAVLDHVDAVNAKQQAAGRSPSQFPRAAWSAQLVQLAQREWRGVAARSSGATPDQCLFKAACAALMALLHDGETLECLGPDWLQEVENQSRGDEFDPRPTTWRPAEWGNQVAFYANLWRVSHDRIGFRTSMLRAAASAFLGWFHLRRTRWALSPSADHPRRRKSARAAS